MRVYSTARQCVYIELFLHRLTLHRRINIISFSRAMYKYLQETERFGKIRVDGSDERRRGTVKEEEGANRRRGSDQQLYTEIGGSTVEKGEGFRIGWNRTESNLRNGQRSVVSREHRP
ncbi:hypothetical protein WN48_01025 [Eufriesea mexicana]|nr:hypothetical protein WN48_01025 [Eufriesea mexicana]